MEVEDGGGSLWVLKYPYCHQIFTNPCLGRQKGSGKNQNLKNSIAYSKSTSQRIYQIHTINK